MFEKYYTGISDATHAICIYHDNCNDGFGAAFVMHLWAEKLLKYKKIFYMPAQYGDTSLREYVQQIMLPLGMTLAKTDLYILDFSFPEAQIQDAMKDMRNVILLDHHKTAQADLQNLQSHNNLHIEFDMEESGVSLAWKYFNPESTMPYFIQLLRDRDLWRKHNPDVDYMHSYLGGITKSFSTWVEPYMVPHKVLKYGELIYYAHQNLLSNIVDNADLVIVTSTATRAYPVKYGILNAPGVLASDLGNMMMKYMPIDFAIVWNVKLAEAVKLSFRSTDDAADVSEIAKSFGGGGHRNAAGGTCDMIVLEQLMKGTFQW